MRSLPLREMHRRHYGLTRAVASSFHEAAKVCLSRHHSSPAIFSIESGPKIEAAKVAWRPLTPRTLAAWNNETDATEAGAYACVIAGVEVARDHRAVRRAETLTGADYYVGPAGAGEHDLEDCYRLEVSGVDAGGDREVRQRVYQKAEQARKGNSNLPATAGVVGFAARVIALVDVEEPV